MNRLSQQIATGTVGELLVQIRLLQYGVQAAPPLKDSGNDLIAVRGEEFRAIQVKTTTRDRFDVRRLPPKFHILACVRLEGEGERLDLDKSRIFLLDQKQVGRISSLSLQNAGQYQINEGLVQKLFKGTASRMRRPQGSAGSP